MVRQALEAEGIPAYVRGEALAGGIGELGVFGLVAVMVPETAWPQARALVDELALGEPVSALDPDPDPDPGACPA